jgi:hypothetical protein
MGNNSLTHDSRFHSQTKAVDANAGKIKGGDPIPQIVADAVRRARVLGLLVIEDDKAGEVPVKAGHACAHVTEM